MLVYFIRGEDIVIGRLTGRTINDKHEIKARDGTYQYTRNYKKYEVKRK